MANLLSRKQVAALIGKGSSYVGTYISRWHLVEKNRKIDTDLKKNKEFLSKFITKEIERVEESETEIPPPNNRKGIKNEFMGKNQNHGRNGFVYYCWLWL